MAGEEITGEACIDCVGVIANADTTGVEDLADWQRRVEAIDASDGGRYVVVLSCADDCEGWFSWSPCDYCGSALGGERHPIAFLETGVAIREDIRHGNYRVTRVYRAPLTPDGVLRLLVTSPYRYGRRMNAEDPRVLAITESLVYGRVAEFGWSSFTVEESAR